MLWERMARELYTGRVFTTNDKYTRVKVERFASFMAKRFLKTRYLETVSIEEISAFFNYLEKDLHLTPRTWNDNLVTLRAVFRRYASFSKTYEWLKDLKRLTGGLISRELFSPEEIGQIIQKAAELDSEIKSMVILASCTGLRLKDICLLEWSSVDFKRNLISLHTYKTGGNVTLGMWPLLYNGLEKLAARNREGEGAVAKYVLPGIAEQYLKNPKVLKDRLTRVLFALGYTGTKPKELRNVKNRSPAKNPKADLGKDRTLNMDRGAQGESLGNCHSLPGRADASPDCQGNAG